MRRASSCLVDQAWAGWVALVLLTVFQIGASWWAQGRPSVEWALEDSALGVVEAFVPEDAETRRRLPDLMRAVDASDGLGALVLAGCVALGSLVLAWIAAAGGAIVVIGLVRAGMPERGAHATALAVWLVPLAVVTGTAATGLVAGVLALAVVVGARPPGPVRTVVRGLLTVAAVGLALVPVARTAHARPWGPNVRPPVDETVVVRHPDGPPPALQPGPDWQAPSPTGLEQAERVVLITVDTLGARHMTDYEPGHDTTPRLTEWAAHQGVVFERSYASAPWTLPSTTTLLTSLHPTQHGLEDDGRRLAEDVPTLAGAFASQGFRTAGFATHIYASSRFGLDSGFHEFWEFSIDASFREGRQLRAEQLNARVRDWLDRHGDERFFIYLHYFDPHWDYESPAPFDARHADPHYEGPAKGTYRFLAPYISRRRRLPPEDLAQVHGLYDGEVAYTDHALGALFEALRERGLWEGTAVAVVSDHGEELQEHGSFGHTRTVYEELIHVPLLLMPPGSRPEGWRARVPEQVRNLDVAPTLLELAGLSVPPTFEGRSLVPLMRAPGAHRDAFARTTRQARLATVVSDRWKLVRSIGGDGGRLFDLRADPEEQSDVAADHPERVEALGARLDAWLEARPGAPARFRRDVGLTAAEREQLEALGYGH